MTEANKTIRVDIISDVVCPWCIVGYKQFRLALDHLGKPLEVALRWHPFELNPAMPAEGENLRSHILEKYGTTSEDSVASRDRLTEMGRDLGITFNYFDDMRIYNTFRAHQLLHWAGVQGKQTALKLELFSAYFTRKENVDDPAVLAEVAARAGLAKEEALEVLDDGRYGEVVRKIESQWPDMGIHGVPALIVEERYLFSGAQGVENYSKILNHFADQAAA